MDKEKPTTLPDLPLELLLVISDHLSPVDIACLALCNRRLLLSLGSACDDLPKNRTGGPEDGPRVDLLTRFSRGLPQYYLCDACLRLHPWHKVALPERLSPQNSLFTLSITRATHITSSILSIFNLSCEGFTTELNLESPFSP
ncbi:Cyclin-like F-box [Penicillium camemberti]|uniref:Cyclin-like F-box n=1 Tax=Penicillium camemberti (strain FM 013) TaxID=1429867 RepID=A0A0G4PMW5_PENC3|nr:Cyclin-like F-box [Penicillium camemberti]